MTYAQMIHTQQSQAFKDGYDAACALQDRDRARSEEWLRGYDAAKSDLDWGC